MGGREVRLSTLRWPASAEWRRDGHRPSADALERHYGLADRVIDDAALANSVERFREQRIVLPTFAELADPSTIDPARASATPIRRAADARNLCRVHWYNDLARRPRSTVPEHVVLPSALTGVESPIIVVFGDRFPMITRPQGAGRLRLPGAADRHRPVRPDPRTGRSGRRRATTPAAASPSAGSWAAAAWPILPEGMSQERFDWLDRWCADPADDVIRTPGTESNVKEIYDACNELAARSRPTSSSTSSASSATTSPTTRSPAGRSSTCSTRVRRRDPGLRLAAFVSATGSAGTIAAGDRLKDALRHADRRRRGARVPDDARERLRRAQHPGHRRQAHPADPQRDEHRRRRRRSATAPPTSSTCCSTPTPAGRYLADRKGVDDDVVDALAHFGLSSICNVLAAIKTAKLLGLGPDDAIVTVATDGAAMYPSERAKCWSPSASVATFDRARRGRGRSAGTSPTSTPTT